MTEGEWTARREALQLRIQLVTVAGQRDALAAEIRRRDTLQWQEQLIALGEKWAPTPEP